jgi:hypothetical protein
VRKFERITNSNVSWSECLSCIKNVPCIKEISNAWLGLIQILWVYVGHALTTYYVNKKIFIFWISNETHEIFSIVVNNAFTK